MRQIGSWTRLLSILFRKDSNDITTRPNQATTYTASRDVQLPPGDADHVLVSASSTQTLTNKTLTSPVVNSPTGITKSDVGLGNVDNTSDATKNSAAVTLTNKTITTPTISSPTVTGTLLLQNATGAQPELALSEDPDNGTDTVTIKAPASLAAAYVLTLPVDDGASGEVLSTDGSGVLSWVSNASTNSFKTTWATAAGTTKTVTHNLGTKDVIVQIFDQTDDQGIEVDTVTRTDINTVTLTATEAPGAASWRILILAV